MSYHRILILPVTMFGLFWASTSVARLPRESDLSYVVERNEASYEVAKDGTYVVDNMVQVAILTEAGRDSQAVKSISFNARAAKFELVHAKTINDDKEIPVASSNIEIKVTGDPKVFDTTKEAVISFPAVRVGSRISFRYRLKVEEVPIEGFFSAGAGVDTENIDVFHRTIRSALPLFQAVDDQKGVLNVESKRDGSKYVVEVKNREKLRYGIVQEESVYLLSNRMPLVLISTQPDWSGFAKAVVSEQEKLLKATLPPVFEKIRVEASKVPLEKRMATVAALVAQEIRYFGDWRRRNGGHIPRSLNEIADTGYGDCKDMSLVVVAIARAMGLEADISWVWRSESFLDDGYYRLPTDYSFNHAIARVEVSDGVVDWIDATNAVAIPRVTFSDIANRSALLLSKKGVRLVRTPEMKSSDAKSRIELSLNFKKGGFEMTGHLAQNGRLASHAAWALLYVPHEQFKYDTINWLAQGEKVDSYDMTLPKEVSRVVSDFTFPVKFMMSDLGMQTTAGVGFPLLRNDVVSTVLTEVRERFTDLWLGSPRIIEENYLMPRVGMVGRYDIGCDVKNEWMKLSRTVKPTAKGVEIRSRYEVMKSVIPNDVLVSKDYATFQSKVRRCFNRSAVILALKPVDVSKSGPKTATKNARTTEPAGTTSGSRSN